MKNYVLCAAILFTFLTIPSNEVYANGDEPLKELTQQEIYVPKGTRIKLKAADPVGSQTHVLHEKVRFTVAADVMSDDRVTVSAGTEVEGTVTKAKRSAVWDKDGQIEVSFTEIPSSTGTMIPVSGKLSVLGEKQNILVKYSLMGALFKGKKATIENGMECDVEISEDTFIGREF